MTAFVPDDTPNVQRPNFFHDGTRDMVEIVSITDTKSTVIKKVTPEVIKQFPREWEAYKEKRPSDDIGGTPLSDVPGLDRNLILTLSLRGIRNAEELAALPDSMCLQIGLGTLNASRTARLLLKANAADAAADTPKRGPGRPRKDDVTDEQQRA